MSEPKKNTLYVDANDEITAVISKLQDAPSRIIAIVLPKRAPVFQSVINLKLLKKAADKAKKKVVLVTSDTSVLPLAGSAQLHVAKTAQSKPYIPQTPTAKTAVQSGLGATATENQLDGSKSVGELAESADTSEEKIDVSDFPKIELDEEEKQKKATKRSGVRVPNFNKFRVLLIVGVLAVLLLGVGWYMAVYILPRADITLETASQSTVQTLELRATPDQNGVDEEAFSLPYAVETYESEESASVETTGERNEGDRASGTITVTNCESQQITIDSGTAFTATGGLVFVSEESVTINPSDREPPFRPEDCEGDQAEDIEVTADEVGADYNINATDYSVEGYSFDTVYGSGGEMSGGTDDLVQVVDEADIQTARQQIEQDSSTEAQGQLEQAHTSAEQTPLPETFTIENTDETAEPEEGSEADEVTVSRRTTYSMRGVALSDIRTLLEAHMSEEIDEATQSIVDDGLADASIRVTDEGDDGLRIRIRTIVAVGPKIDAPEIAQSVAGLARSETRSLLIAREGIRDVQIDYSPFWVFSTPSDTEKIYIEVMQQEAAPADIPPEDEEPTDE